MADNKINWSDFCIALNEDKFMMKYLLKKSPFEITPEEYLEWADEEYNTHKKKMSSKIKINIMCNIKRAIDSKVMGTLQRFGYENKISDKNYPLLKKYFGEDDNAAISILGYIIDVDTTIITEIRKVRNFIEHEFRVPTDEDVKRAISGAKLFLLAIDSKIENTAFYITLTCSKYQNTVDILLSGIEDYNSLQDKVRWDIDISIKNLDEKGILKDSRELRAVNEDYIEWLHILVNRKYKNIPKLMGSSIPEDKIYYKEYLDEEDMLFDMEESELPF